MIAQAADDAILPAEFVVFGRSIGWLGMDQERSASIHVGAQEINASRGIIPVVNDYVLQFFMQKLFSGFFVGGIHFDKVGQDTDWFKLRSFAALNGGEQALDGFRCIGAVGD